MSDQRTNRIAMRYIHFQPSIPNRPIGFGYGYIVTKSYTYPHNIAVTNIPREITTSQLVQHSGPQMTQSTSTGTSHVKPREKDIHADWLFIGDATQHAPIPNPVTPPPIFSPLDVKKTIGQAPVPRPPPFGPSPETVNPLLRVLEHRVIFPYNQQMP